MRKSSRWRRFTENIVRLRHRTRRGEPQEEARKVAEASLVKAADNLPSGVVITPCPVCRDESSRGVPHEMFCMDHRPVPKVDVVEAAKIEVAKAMYDTATELVRYERRDSERLPYLHLQQEILEKTLAAWGWKRLWRNGEYRWEKL